MLGEGKKIVLACWMTETETDRQTDRDRETEREGKRIIHKRLVKEKM